MLNKRSTSLKFLALIRLCPSTASLPCYPVPGCQTYFLGEHCQTNLNSHREISASVRTVHHCRKTNDTKWQAKTCQVGRSPRKAEMEFTVIMILKQTFKVVKTKASHIWIKIQLVQQKSAWLFPQLSFKVHFLKQIKRSTWWNTEKVALSKTACQNN